jgi:hypothetical protein
MNYQDVLADESTPLTDEQVDSLRAGLVARDEVAR